MIQYPAAIPFFRESLAAVTWSDTLRASETGLPYIIPLGPRMTAFTTAATRSIGDTRNYEQRLV